METPGRSGVFRYALAAAATAGVVAAAILLHRRPATGSAGARPGYTRSAYSWKQLPKDAYCYKENKRWTEETFPKGFLVSHNTKAGVWGELEVLSGSLRFVILDGKEGEVLATREIPAGARGVVEPRQYHRVDLAGPVEATLRFYRLPEADGSRPMTTPLVQ
mmetsp:Transcript_85027/g.245562  ORF Transcript_85027/g.245562 Transcript_85027/m.245562 type:complete len:162 (+) Transcript_85027:74-559(+)|eukprot:CAMPEP_0170266998 /NCGR_PEP_ID=MMETSP0116_2-20130129/33422_1 /TAXON_ID=400756 /ORGANISM="Durinskia baltica, Strain CSIRO CS-38" /LENGTH=161 /DNA_ID=CAMNT_0010518147 /DNA_START=64 /DNA_END=549 /DNA_ORIENTATION=+